MATMYEVHTETYSIYLDQKEYHVLKSKPLEKNLLLPSGYHVLYNSTDFKDAQMWLHNHLRAKAI